jgi:hypothetical protein
MQSPSTDPNRIPSGQEIPCLLWNQTVYYSRHKSPIIVHNGSCTNPVHSLPSHFLTIHFSVILPSTPWSSKWSTSFHSNSTTQYILQRNVHYRLIQWINWPWYFDHTAVNVMAMVFCNMTVRSIYRTAQDTPNITVKEQNSVIQGF